MQSPDFWSALKRVKERLGFKFGVSVYDPEPTREMLERHGDAIDCLQAPYNVADRRFESLAKLLQEKGIVFISRSTFLKGALAEKRLPAELKGLKPVRDRLRQISEESGLTPAQLLLHFALSAPFIDCTLIGVNSAEQLREDLDLERSRGKFIRHQQELMEVRVEDPFLIDPRRWTSL